jgi:hypothetical protein
MTDDAAESGPELLPFHEDRPAMAGLRVLQATQTQQPGTEPNRTCARTGPVYHVIVACAQCGTPRTFQGTVAEIGDEAEGWSRSHRRAVYGDDLPQP